MPRDFELVALRTAVDARRTALALSWADIGAELGVSPGTLRRLGARRTARPLGSNEIPLPPAPRTLRFDARALYSALDAERAARGLTWRAVAAASGVGSAGALARLRAGERVMFPQIMRVLTWLGAPAAQFVRAKAQ